MNRIDERMNDERINEGRINFWNLRRTTWVQRWGWGTGWRWAAPGSDPAGCTPEPINQ